MKHAGAETLKALEVVLNQIRQIPGLIEKKPGVFYRKSGAYLHFHEDAAGIFADVKLDRATSTRLAVNTSKQQAILLTAVRKNCL